MFSKSLTVSFVGSAQSGKSIALALLHAAAIRIARRNGLEYATWTMTEGLEIYSIVERFVTQGIPPQSTDPVHGTLPVGMDFKFHDMIDLFPKKMRTAAVDISGELVEGLMGALKSSNREIQKVKNRYYADMKVSRDDQKRIDECILDCNIFVAVIDGTAAATGKPSASGITQDAGLAYFLENIRKWKEQNKKTSPPVRGVALLLTRTDEISKLGLLPMDPNEEELAAFLERKMLNTMGNFLWFRHRKRVKTEILYHWLVPLEGEGDSKAKRFLVEKTADNAEIVAHPTQQYEKLIAWFKRAS